MKTAEEILDQVGFFISPEKKKQIISAMEEYANQKQPDINQQLAEEIANIPEDIFCKHIDNLIDKINQPHHPVDIERLAEEGLLPLGTKLKAKSKCNMRDGSGEALKKGKKYEVILHSEVRDEIAVKSELFPCHFFSIKKEDDDYWGKYFELI